MKTSMIKQILRFTAFMTFCGMLLTVGMTACSTNDSGDATDNTSKNETVPETTPAPSTPDVTEPEGYDRKPLSDILHNVFTSSKVVNETVMFIDYGDSKQLLHTPDEILSVTSYDGKIKYAEGKDYELRDGKLTVLKGSSMPCITSSRYYKGDGTIKLNGKPLYWGEGDSMTKWQVCVSYTHSDTWDKYLQRSYTERYSDFIKKLENGEDVTVYFYGDSITAGANASSFIGTAPYQDTYTVLFLRALAENYEYTVSFKDVTPGNPLSDKIHTKKKVYGDRGTITYVNSAIGGWATMNGLSDMNSVVGNINSYGCDLFVLAFGMNDGYTAASTVKSMQKQILDKVIATAPDASLMIVSTMVPHPGTDWYQGQASQWKELEKLADEYNGAGTPCALANMTLVSEAIYSSKDFEDCTGNNINHPNDFLSRVYAQTLYQTLIGY